uniref:SHSP domain-containing protein n=1 Tax=Plectus sambesii TaxID=2011161 RepID=A0A914VRZ3_9BILA
MFLLPLSRFQSVAPVERFLEGIFDDDMGEMRHQERPYWIACHQNPSAFAKSVGNVRDDKDKFSVSVDVQHFAPNEIKVTASGRQLVIEGKHEEKSDERGQIERHFVRKYMLPKEVAVDQVVSHLSQDGVLTVSAPKNAIEGPPVRTIPILPTPEVEHVDQTKKQ